MSIISVLPDPLVNGTTADAVEVMADLNQIVNDVNMNAAENSANSSITSLAGLTTPLSVSQGGTAAATPAGARTNLGIDPLVVPTGVVEDYIGSSAPTGYVLADGKTIGDASSGGTERANADTVDLFTLLWNSMADAQAPVSTGRGASAAADFAAHKTITLPDLRGRVVIGKDNMGGTTASRVTAAVSGITGTTLGAAGGDQNSQAHAHGVSDPGHAHNNTLGNNTWGGWNNGADGAFDARSLVATGSDMNLCNMVGAATGIGIQTFGSGAAQNVQPSYVLNKIIKL